MEAFDSINVAARKKLGVPETWKWWKVEVVGRTSDYLVVGGIPRLTKKGKETWRGVASDTCVVTKPDRDAVIAEFEAVTGKCARCGGDGQEMAGWSAESGTRYRTCSKCKGSGQTRTEEEA